MPTQLKLVEEDEERLLISPLRAFKLIDVSKTYGYELIRKGIIPSIKIGTVIRIPLQEFKKWIAEQLAESQQ